jgi:hypothetical protein
MTGRFASLSFVCQSLRPGLQSAGVSSLHAMISNNAVNWEYVVAFANAQLVITALWKALCDKKLQDVLPEDVSSYLSELHSLNHKRNAAMRLQMEEIIRNLNLEGLEPLLLKGAALMFMGAFDDPAERIMMDVDIMVRTEDAKKTMENLSVLGYRSMEQDHLAYRYCQHLAPMARDHDAASVEVHTELFHSIDDPIVLGPKEVWRESERVNINGLAFRVLSPTHFVVHNIVHSEAHHHCFALGKIPMRDLLDLAVFLRLRARDVDWREIDLSMGRHGLRRMARSHMHMGSRLFGVTVPAAMGPSAGSWLHYARCIILSSCRPVQAIEDWRTLLTGNVMRVCRLFSARTLQLRFGCSDGWMDLTRTRLRYLAYLAKKYMISSKRNVLIDLPAGRKGLIPSDTAVKEVKDENSRR